MSAISPGPVDTDSIVENLEDVPDLVLAQPMSTAADGEVERVIPQVTGYLATTGYLFPALRSFMLPPMAWRGKEAKGADRKRSAASRGERSRSRCRGDLSRHPGSAIENRTRA